MDFDVQAGAYALNPVVYRFDLEPPDVGVVERLSADQPWRDDTIVAEDELADASPCGLLGNVRPERAAAPAGHELPPREVGK